jgi:conjugal transfer ATP-binding protein TraC
VLELLSLEDKPKLLSSILFSLILAIQEKMYHSPRDLKKVCIIDEAWRLLGGSNPHAARFIETGYRTVRRHRGAFITITQGIKDFSASKEAEAAWNNSSTKITLCRMRRRLNSTLPITRISSRTWKKKLSVASSPPCRPATAPC